MKLVCFGDSLTEGAYGGSYVNALRQRSPAHTILNAGLGGSTVINLLRRVETDVIDAQPEDDAFTHTLIEMFMVEANEAIASRIT